MGRQLITPTAPPGHHRRPAGAVAVGLLLMAMAAAGYYAYYASTPHRGAAGCGVYPPILDQPQPLTRGQQVTIASRGYMCTRGHVSGTESVYFNEHLSPEPPLGSAQVAPNGAFHITIRIPTDAPLGRASLLVGGPTTYFCTGGTASCARYGLVVTISH